MSFVMGHGDRAPRNPSDLLFQSGYIPRERMSGRIVGGPCVNADDPYKPGVYESYRDTASEEDSVMFNEPTNQDQNSAVLFANIMPGLLRSRERELGRPAVAEYTQTQETGDIHVLYPNQAVELAAELLPIIQEKRGDNIYVDENPSDAMSRHYQIRAMKSNLDPVAGWVPGDKLSNNNLVAKAFWNDDGSWTVVTVDGQVYNNMSRPAFSMEERAVRRDNSIYISALLSEAGYTQTMVNAGAGMVKQSWAPPADNSQLQPVTVEYIREDSLDGGLLSRLFTVRAESSTLSQPSWQTAEISSQEVEDAWQFRGKSRMWPTIAVSNPLFDINAIPDLLDPGSVLDVGCGAGHLAVLMAVEGHRVVGLDLSEDQIKTAKEHRWNCSYPSGDFSSRHKIFARHNGKYPWQSPKYRFKFLIFEPYRHFPYPDMVWLDGRRLYSETELKQAEHRLTFLHGDFNDLELIRQLSRACTTFDNIVVACALHHMHPLELLRSAQILLNAKGKLIIEISDIKPYSLTTLLRHYGDDYESRWLLEKFPELKPQLAVYRFAPFHALAQAAGFVIASEFARYEDGAYYLVLRKEKGYDHDTVRGLYEQSMPAEQYGQFFRQGTWRAIGAVVHDAVSSVSVDAAADLRDSYDHFMKKVDHALASEDPFQKLDESISTQLFNDYLREARDLAGKQADGGRQSTLNEFRPGDNEAVKSTVAEDSASSPADLNRTSVIPAEKRRMRIIEIHTNKIKVSYNRPSLSAVLTRYYIDAPEWLAYKRVIHIRVSPVPESERDRVRRELVRIYRRYYDNTARTKGIAYKYLVIIHWDNERFGRGNALTFNDLPQWEFVRSGRGGSLKADPLPLDPRGRIDMQKIMTLLYVRRQYSNENMFGLTRLFDQIKERSRYRQWGIIHKRSEREYALLIHKYQWARVHDRNRYFTRDLVTGFLSDGEFHTVIPQKIFSDMGLERLFGEGMDRIMRRDSGRRQKDGGALDERKVIRQLAAPSTGYDLARMLGIQTLHGAARLFQICNTSKSIATHCAAEHYIRISTRNHTQAVLSPAPLRSFLDYEIVARSGDRRADAYVLNLRENITKISANKMNLARAAMEKLIKNGYGRRGLVFFINGDVGLHLANEHKREDAVSGELMKGSDLDVLVVTGALWKGSESVLTRDLDRIAGHLAVIWHEALDYELFCREAVLASAKAIDDSDAIAMSKFMKCRYLCGDRRLAQKILDTVRTSPWQAHFARMFAVASAQRSVFMDELYVTPIEDWDGRMVKQFLGPGEQYWDFSVGFINGRGQLDGGALDDTWASLSDAEQYVLAVAAYHFPDTFLPKDLMGISVKAELYIRPEVNYFVAHAVKKVNNGSAFITTVSRRYKMGALLRAYIKERVSEDPLVAEISPQTFRQKLDQVVKSTPGLTQIQARNKGAFSQRHPQLVADYELLCAAGRIRHWDKEVLAAFARNKTNGCQQRDGGTLVIGDTEDLAREIDLENIRAVVLDIAGVLFDNPADAVLKRFQRTIKERSGMNIPLEELEKLIFTGKRAKAMRRSLPIEEYNVWLNNALRFIAPGLAPFTVPDVAGMLSLDYQPISQIQEFVKDMHERGIPIYVLSNYFVSADNHLAAEIKNKIVAHYPQIKKENIFLSHEIKLAKPDRRAFTYVLRSSQSAASEVLFIDDQCANAFFGYRFGFHSCCYHKRTMTRTISKNNFIYKDKTDRNYYFTYGHPGDEVRIDYYEELNGMKHIIRVWSDRTGIVEPYKQIWDMDSGKLIGVYNLALNKKRFEGYTQGRTALIRKDALNANGALFIGSRLWAGFQRYGAEEIEIIVKDKLVREVLVLSSQERLEFKYVLSADGTTIDTFWKLGDNSMRQWPDRFTVGNLRVTRTGNLEFNNRVIQSVFHTYAGYKAEIDIEQGATGDLVWSQARVYDKQGAVVASRNFNMIYDVNDNPVDFFQKDLENLARYSALGVYKIKTYYKLPQWSMLRSGLYLEARLRDHRADEVTVYIAGNDICGIAYKPGKIYFFDPVTRALTELTSENDIVTYGILWNACTSRELEFLGILARDFKNPIIASAIKAKSTEGYKIIQEEGKGLLKVLSDTLVVNGKRVLERKFSRYCLNPDVRAFMQKVMPAPKRKAPVIMSPSALRNVILEKAAKARFSRSRTADKSEFYSVDPYLVDVFDVFKARGAIAVSWRTFILSNGKNGNGGQAVNGANGVKQTAKRANRKTKGDYIVKNTRDRLVNKTTGPPKDGGKASFLRSWQELAQQGLLTGILPLVLEGNVDRQQAVRRTLDGIALNAGVPNITDTLDEIYFEDEHAILVYSFPPGKALVRIAPDYFVDYLTDSRKTISYFGNGLRVDIIFDDQEIQYITDELSLYAAHPELYGYVYALDSDDPDKVVKTMEKIRVRLADDSISHELLRLLTALLGHPSAVVQRRAAALLNNVRSGRPLEFPAANVTRIVSPGSVIVPGEIRMTVGFNPFSDKEQLAGMKARLVIAQSGGGNRQYRNLVVEPLSDRSVILRIAHSANKLVARKGMVHISLQTKLAEERKWGYGEDSSANQTLIVQPDIRGSRMYQLWPQYMGVYDESGKVRYDHTGRALSGTFQTAIDMLPYLKESGFTHVYLMGIYQLDRPENIKGQVGPDASLFSPLKWAVSKELGGEEGLKRLIKEAEAQDIRILVDLIPHVNQNFADLPEWAIVKARGDGRIVRRLATDGAINHENGLPVEWHDSVMLNFRDSRVMESIINLTERLAALGIAGVRIDVAHNFGSMLPVEPGLRSKQKLFGHITSWERNERGGYRIVNAWDENQPNPYLVHLVSRISTQYPEFIFIGENYGKYIQLIKSGVMPMDSGTHDDLEHVLLGKAPKSVLDSHFRWLLGQLPEGSQVVTALETHDYFRAMDRWQSFGPTKLSAAVWAWLAATRGALMVYNRQEIGEVHRIRIDNYTKHDYEEADRQRYYAQLEFEQLTGETVQDFYRRALAFYKEHPVLSRGNNWIFDASDKVFVIARYDSKENLIFLVNTSWETTRVTVDLAPLWDAIGVHESIRKFYRVVDLQSNSTQVFTGCELRSLTLEHTVGSYQAAILTVREVRDEKGIDIQTTALRDALARYTEEDLAVRIASNFAFMWLEEPLIAGKPRQFLKRFSQLAAFIGESGIITGDLTLLLHEMQKKHPGLQNRIRMLLEKAKRNTGTNRITDIAAQILRWIDIGSIVFVSPEAKPVSAAGGMASVVGELAEVLVKSGLKVYIVSPLYKYIEKNNFSVADLKHSTIAHFNVKYTGKPLKVYVGRHGMFSSGLARTRINGVEHLLLDNPYFADSLYGQYRIESNSAVSRVTKEHEMLRAIFLSFGALEAMKVMNVYPSIVIGNDWMCAPLMAHLNSMRSLYKQDPHFLYTRTIGWVHNNGQDYQFKVERFQDGVDLLSNIGLPAEDYGWFIDPHRDNYINLMAAFIRHAHYVVAVSPGQMADYLASDDKGGGEGLMHIFREKMAQKKLFAITNGVSLKKLQEEWFGLSCLDVKNNADEQRLVDAVYHERSVAKNVVANFHPYWFASDGRSNFIHDGTFVIVLLSRAAEQKGIHFVVSFVRNIIHSGLYPDVAFVFNAPGDKYWTDQLIRLAFEFPGRVGFYNDYLPDRDPERIKSRTFLCGDLFIAFSLWEPGGISPMKALAFGSPCLVSDKQGHKSTVKTLHVPEFSRTINITEDEAGANGVRFPIDEGNFHQTIANSIIAFDKLYSIWSKRTVDLGWRQLVRNAVFSDNSWEASLRAAENLFKFALTDNEKYYQKFFPSKNDGGAQNENKQHELKFYDGRVVVEKSAADFLSGRELYYRVSTCSGGRACGEPELRRARRYKMEDEIIRIGQSVIFVSAFQLQFCLRYQAPIRIYYSGATGDLALRDGGRGPSYRIPLAFPNLFDNQRGWNDPEWLESYITAQAILSMADSCETALSVSAIIDPAASVFADHGLAADRARILQRLEGLRRRGLIRAEDNNFSLEFDSTVYLNAEPRVIAVWAHDFEYIRRDIERSMSEGRQALFAAVDAYASVLDQWSQYPIESMYPVLQAIAQMIAEDQQKLVDWLLTRSQWMRSSLINAIILMLDFDRGSANWLEKWAPQLSGRSIYVVAAEISLLAGGLGRVEQYHSTAMARLGAKILYVEPYYMKTRDKLGRVVTLDYSKLPVPVSNIRRMKQVFNTFVGGSPVAFHVYEAVNELGIRTYMIKDIKGYYVNILYEYNTSDAPASSFEFTEFFTKAALELIRFLEVKQLEELGSAYKAPLVDINDGQALPLAAWRRIFYGEKSRIMTEGTDSREIDNAYRILDEAIFSATTHTYRNRVFIGGDIKGYGLQFLRAAGVPDEWLWLFLRKELNGDNLWDMTSAGLRSADVTKAVSAIHAYEMNARDPGTDLVGVTNGDNRVYSAEFFRKELDRIGVSDYEHVTPEQVAKAKQAAKKNIGLNPQQMVVSYSGRLVPEKAGRDRAFTDSNIERMVKAGIQVVIYGNIQPYEASQRIGVELQQLRDRIERMRYAGRFIFKAKFNIDEQRQLLAASDIQVQDSDRYTGAAEYTEADVSANAGLQMGAPFWEGIIQHQGIAINRRRQTGNTLIPASVDPQSYLDAIFWAHDEFKNGSLGIYQAQSVRFSRVLEASLTAAAYLTLWSNAFLQRPGRKALPRVPGEIYDIDKMAITSYLEDGERILEREGDTFHIKGKVQELRENLEFSVMVHLEALDHINFETKRTGPVSFESIRADLVNEYGVRLPLKVKRAGPNKAEYYTLIPADLPLPFQGNLEITSGVWKIAKPVRIVAQETGTMCLVSPAQAQDRQLRYAGLIEQLQSAAGHFLYYDKKLSGWTVIAGSPHFDQRQNAWLYNWTRDAMISLPGLCLCTGRTALFKAVLRTYLRYVDHGLMPNLVGDGKNPQYNCVDASLLFMWALGKYLEATGDYAFLNEMIERSSAAGEAASVRSLAEEIMQAYEQGITRPHVWQDNEGAVSYLRTISVKMDPRDNLLCAGDRSTQLTWMDAQRNGTPVTSRYGKAVDINALWFNALNVMADMYGKEGKSAQAERYRNLAGKVRSNFDAFWNEEARCLFDTLDGDRQQGCQVRPNQLFAVAAGLFDAERAQTIVDTVNKELFTPYGLRTLAAQDAQYKAYHTDEYSYHQGTIWPWLSGVFIEACVRVYGIDSTVQLLAEQHYFTQLSRLIDMNALRSLPEILDGDCDIVAGSWNERGCSAQAWSVAETLRGLVLLFPDKTSLPWALADTSSRIVYEMAVRDYCDARNNVSGLRKARAELQYLADSGIAYIYLLGVMKHTGSPFEILDPYLIDERAGDEDDLRDFINEAHSLGIRVIIDWLANQHVAKSASLTRDHPQRFLFTNATDGNFFTEEKTTLVQGGEIDAESLLRKVELGKKFRDTITAGTYPEAGSVMISNDRVDYIPAQKSLRESIGYRGSREYIVTSGNALFVVSATDEVPLRCFPRRWGSLAQPDLSSIEVREEAVNIGMFWMGKGFDGFRIDAALSTLPDKVKENWGIQVESNLTHDFIHAIRRAYPDAFILFEGFERHPELLELADFRYTGVYNWKPRNYAAEALSDRTKQSVLNGYLTELDAMPTGFQQNLVSIGPEHDAFDFRDPWALLDQRSKALLYFLYLVLPGYSLIFNGQVYGKDHMFKTDMGQTAPAPSIDKTATVDQAAGRTLFSIRDRYPVLKRGWYMPLSGPDSDIVAVARFDEEHIVIGALNLLDEDRAANFNVESLTALLGPGQITLAREAVVGDVSFLAGMDNRTDISITLEARSAGLIRIERTRDLRDGGRRDILQQYYQEKLGLLNDAIRKDIGRSDITLDELTGPLFNPSKVVGPTALARMYFVEKHPDISSAVKQAYRSIINDAPAYIKAIQLELFKERMAELGWDKAVDAWVRQNCRYEGNYRIVDLKDASIGRNVYKLLIRFDNGTMTECILKSQADKPGYDVAYEAIWVELQHVLLGVDIQEGAYAFRNPAGPDVLVEAVFRGTPANGVVSMWIRQNNCEMLLQLISKLTPHLVLEHILGCNDHGLRNKYIYVVGDEIANIADFDVEFRFFVFENFVWEQEDTRQGVSEFNVLALLPVFANDAAGATFMARFDKAYIDAWAQIARRRAVVKDVIARHL
ncbi:MAG TPA: amylo-alpha-1,6-glucosidase, partial [Candidatus Omnitrophota bacterium]|nr:amylo-alpha-1,6-glucosidase [Candidatus Omnitrophota bacterium]